MWISEFVSGTNLRILNCKQLLIKVLNRLAVQYGSRDCTVTMVNIWVSESVSDDPSS